MLYYVVFNYKFNKFLNADFWRRSAVMKLTDKLKTQPLEKEARNVVFFLGDGWLAKYTKQYLIYMVRVKIDKMFIVL